VFLQAKVMFTHDRLSLNASVGLHTEPHLKIAAMAGSNIISGGGSLCFNTRNGLIRNFDIGASIVDPDLGTFSTVFNL
jgi:hypothetical protein